MRKRVQPPIFVINCKAYLEMTGRRALATAKIADQVSEETGVSFLMIVQLTDIAPVSQEVRNVAVFAPHLDPVRPGPHTGHVLAEALSEAGADGALINHAERKLTLSDIRVAIDRAREVGLASMVCANTPLEAKAIAVFKPDFMVVEPPELIGTGKAVSTTIKDFIPEAVKAVKSVDPHIIVFTGAGITYPKDAEEAIRMGAEGTGGSKFMTNIADKKRILLDMANAVKRGWETRSMLGSSASKVE